MDVEYVCVCCQLEYEESTGGLGHLLLSGRPDKMRAVSQAVCFPLESMLLALKVSHVDYLSLDVEGREMDVLATMPLQHGIQVDIISVEYAHSGWSKVNYRQAMAHHGYQLYQDIHKASWFRPVGFARDYVFVRQELLQNRTDVSKNFNVKI